MAQSKPAAPKPKSVPMKPNGSSRGPSRGGRK